AAFPLPAREVVGQVARSECPECDTCRLAAKLLPVWRAKAETGDHLVCPTGKRLEHSLGLAGVRGLADRLAGADDDRVHAQHGPRAAVDRASLAGGVLDRIAARLLLVVRADDLEGNPELLEDRPALRR